MTNLPLHLGLAGCTGRMGVAVTEMAGSMESVALSAGMTRKGSPEHMPLLFMANNIPVVHDAEALMDLCDAAIDFTAPEMTLALAKAASSRHKALVIGTTGLDAAGRAIIEQAAKHAAIVWSGNFSFGVAVLEALVERAARLLSEEYDIEVDEMHHRLKKDSPSGTALLLARAAAHGRGVDESAFVHHGAGLMAERQPGSIGLSARRGGEVVGVHTVTFAGPGENLELTHRGFSRATYARGAINAALWAAAKPPGLYTMRDVLGL